MIKKLLIKILTAPFRLIKRIINIKRRPKYTEYDVFLKNVKDTMALTVDFRAEYKTELMNVIINPLKPIRTPKKPKKEVKENEEIEEIN